MTERPILFSGPMVRAILEGRKTHTRRVIKLPDDVTEGPRYWTTPSGRPETGYTDPGVNYWTPRGNHIDPCPYGFPGDRLWVRETWAVFDFDGVPYDPAAYAIGYKASECDENDIVDNDAVEWLDAPKGQRNLCAKNGNYPDPTGTWRPSIHMPRWACRLFIDVKAIRVERLQDISETDAKAEGLPKPLEPIGVAEWKPIQWFRMLWDGLNADRGYGWDTNPWVWVIEFEPAPRERDQGGLDET
jgi:hypothetical protein